MKNCIIVTVIMAIVLATGQSFAVVTFQTGFEPSNDVSGANYLPGTIEGQNGWVKIGTSGTTNTTVVSDNLTYAGSGSLSINGNINYVGVAHPSGINNTLLPNGTIVISAKIVARDIISSTGHGRVDIKSSGFGKLFGWYLIGNPSSQAYSAAEFPSATDADAVPAIADSWAGRYGAGTTTGYVNNANWPRVMSRQVALTITITATTVTFNSVNLTATDAGMASTVTATYTWPTPLADIRNFGDIQFINLSPNGSSFVMGLDDLKIEYIAPIGNVTGTVNLGSEFTGSLQDVGLRLDLRQGSTTTSQWVFPDATGKFTLVNVLAGTYDAIGVKAVGWLRKSFVSQTVSTGATLDLGTINLTGGDCDGDNTVTSTDLAAVLANMDQTGDQ